MFAALDEAIAFIKAHPDRAAAIGAKVYGYPKAIIATGIKRYIKDDVWDLKTDWKAFDTVIRGMRESGTLSGPLDIKHLMNQQYLPKADRSPTA